MGSRKSCGFVFANIPCKRVAESGVSQFETVATLDELYLRIAIDKVRLMAS